MSASILGDLHGELKHLLDRYHPQAQAGRFLVTFAAALWLQVRGGASITGWSDLVSLLAGAAHVAYRQWRKTLPAAAVLQAVHDARTDAQLAEAEPDTG